MTLIDARTDRRTAPNHPTADEFDVSCEAVWPTPVTFDASDPVFREDTWLAIAHEDDAAEWEFVDYIPANIPA